jgi:methionine-rich copper-binding protein CopC
MTDARSRAQEGYTRGIGGRRWLTGRKLLVGVLGALVVLAVGVISAAALVGLPTILTSNTNSPTTNSNAPTTNSNAGASQALPTVEDFAAGTPQEGATLSAAATPKEMNFACALKSNGLMRYVANLTQCKTSEQQITIKPGPVRLCIQPDGSVRKVSSFANCKPPASRLTLPPTSGTTYFCAANSTGVLRKVSGPSRCTSSEFAVFVTPNDAAPSVNSTLPANNADHIAVNNNIDITFSESVSASTSSFTLVCGGNTKAFALSGSPGSSLTLDPNSDLPEGTSCTVKALANQITDTDTLDPPNNMSADHTFSFTTDSAPVVSGTSPANNATDVDPSGDLSVTFSEPVNASASSFALECPSGTSESFSVSGSGTKSITLNPDEELPGATECTVTVLASQISDADTGDPPNNLAANHVSTFTTADAAPFVSSTTPEEEADHVGADTNITLEFSEPVDASGSSFTLECPSGTSQGFSVSGSGSSTITLDPTGDLPEGTSCTLEVIANQIGDVDTVDPPNNMAADFTFSFKIDAAPTVTGHTPADDATAIGPATNITVGFSEPVTVGTNSFTLECNSNPQSFSVSGSGTNSITLDPDSDLPSTSSCTVTAVAANISDTDDGDPPDNLAANESFSFTTQDAGPSVTSTTPVDGAKDVARDADIEITFDETVNATTNAFALECPSGTPTAFTPSGSGTSTITLTPDADLPAGEVCTVTVDKDEISDTDTVDPPDKLATDLTFSFTVIANQAPTAISLDDSDVEENQPSGTTVGKLSTADADAGDTFTYTLVSGAGDNSSFQIGGTDNDELQTSAVFDFETKSSYTVRVRSTDSGSSSTEEEFTISVTDLNEAPTANNDTATTDEDTALNVAAPGVLGNDADHDAGDSMTVGKLNGSTALTGTSAKGAEVTIDANGSYTYNPGQIFQSLPAGQQDTDTFTYTAKDSANLESDIALVTITITGVADPPKLTSSGGTLTYTENAPPTPVDGGLSVTHPEGVQITEATVKIDANHQSGQDVLAFSDNDTNDGITQSGTFDSTTGELKLTGSGSAAEYQAALRSVTYTNTSENPSTATRAVTFAVTDANSVTSDPATRDIAVAAEEDPPVAVADSATVTEDDPATDVAVLANDTDVDGGPKTVNSVTQPTNGTVVITGGGSGLTYQPKANYCNDPPATNLDTFTYKLNGDSQATVSMKVTCVNDAPTVTNDGFSGAIHNTSFVVDDSNDPAPGVMGAKKTITGDVLANDSDPETPGSISVVANGNITSTNGGKATIESDGDFTYVSDPSDNCSLSQDTFNYTVTDNDPSGAQTAQGTITINLSGCVWYVDNDPAETGNAGTSADPFDALGSAQAKSVANQSVFVHKGTSAYTGGFNLEANERLIGEAVNLVVGGDTLLTGDPTKRPILTDNNDDVVALDDANEVRGLELDPQGTGGGIAGATGDTGGATIVDVRINDTGTSGTQPGLELDSTTGTFNISNLVVNNFATGVRLHNTTTPTNAVNAVFATAGQISIQSNGAPGLSVNGTSAVPVNMGTSMFDDITVTGSGNGGVSMSNTTGTTAFGDGSGTDLALTTTSGTAPAFNLSTAGTVAVPSSGTANVSATGGPAVDINATSTNATGFNFDDVDSTGSAGDGINLDGLGTGTFSAASGDIGGASGIAFDLNGGSGNITYPGNLNNGPGLLASEITGRTGGTVTLGGAIADSSDGGGGISLSGNTGGSTTFSATSKVLNTGSGAAFSATGSGHTINFTNGGLDIDTTSATGFSATGGGTVTVQTGTNANTIDTTTGTALNVANTNIGSNGLTFRSISAGTGTGSAGNGINLNSTGSSGGLTVTGTGTTAGSGGTIQHKTGADGSTTSGIGIFLNDTDQVSLSNMNLHDFGNYAIRGNQMIGFALTNSTIDGVNGTNPNVDESAVRLTELTGSAAFTGGTIEGGIEDNVTIINSSGTLNRATFSGVNIGLMDTGNASGDNGILINSTGGGAVMNTTVQNSTFDGARGDMFQAEAGPGTSMDVVLDNNDFLNVHPNVVTGGGGLALSSSSGTMTYDVNNNDMTGARGDAIILVANSSTGPVSMSGRVRNNRIGTSGVDLSGAREASAIEVRNQSITSGGSNATMTTSITSNTIRQYGNHGILLQGTEEGNDYNLTFNATVTGNLIEQPNSNLFTHKNGIHINSGTTTGDDFSGCFDIGGAGALANSLAGSGTETSIGQDIIVRNRQLTSIRMPGYTGGATDEAAVEAYLAARNSGNGVPSTNALYSAGAGGFLNTSPPGSPCPLP